MESVVMGWFLIIVSFVVLIFIMHKVYTHVTALLSLEKPVGAIISPYVGQHVMSLKGWLAEITGEVPSGGLIVSLIVRQPNGDLTTMFPEDLRWDPNNDRWREVGP